MTKLKNGSQIKTKGIKQLLIINWHDALLLPLKVKKIKTFRWKNETSFFPQNNTWDSNTAGNNTFIYIKKLYIQSCNSSALQEKFLQITKLPETIAVKKFCLSFQKETQKWWK